MQWSARCGSFSKRKRKREAGTGAQRAFYPDVFRRVEPLIRRGKLHAPLPVRRA